jgi:hypothetical protein
MKTRMSKSSFVKLFLPYGYSEPVPWDQFIPDKLRMKPICFNLTPTALHPNVSTMNENHQTQSSHF